MTDAINRAPTLEMLRTRRDDILALTRRYRVTNVRVFGSVARGEAIPDSDVDFLVTADGGVSMFDLVGLWLDLKDLLGYEVSLITDDVDPRREQFMKNAYQDAIAL